MNRKKENRFFSNSKIIVVIMAVSIVISAFLCGCKNDNGQSPAVVKSLNSSVVRTEGALPVATAETEQPTEKTENPSVFYEEKIMEVNGRQNHVFLLTVDIGDENVKVIPYLAFNRIFGFEYLQSMTEATEALAAVNAGFFFEYGLPSGLVVNDGKIISSGSGKFYSLIIENGKARFEIVKTSVILRIGDVDIEIDNYNRSSKGLGTAVFSSAYGSTDRLGYFRRVITIKDGIIAKSIKTEAPAKIPQNGFVVTLPAEFKFDLDLIKSRATIMFNPDYDDGVMAYECASMLVKNGISLAGDTMPWVGNLNHYDPRTCVGIMEDGRLGFVVVDGRQQDYSSGTTGRETADIMIELGFVDAVMLDGGGSSSMIYKGITVNSPSSGPMGRPIAGGFMIISE